MTVELAALLEWVGAWPGAAALRGSSTLYLLTNAAHILSLALLVGCAVVLDLRLLGAFGRVPLAAVGPLLSGVAATGLAAAILTGLCLFSVRPEAYAGNPAFQTKLALLALATANAAVVSRTPAWRIAIAGGRVGAPLRLAALVSLMLWLSVVVAGRWIGFV